MQLQDVLAALDMTKWGGSATWWRFYNMARFYNMTRFYNMARFYNMWKGRANL